MCILSGVHFGCASPHAHTSVLYSSSVCHLYEQSRFFCLYLIGFFCFITALHYFVCFECFVVLEIETVILQGKHSTIGFVLIPTSTPPTFSFSLVVFCYTSC